MDLHHHRVWSRVDVRCGETQQAEAGADEAVLASVILNHPIAMAAPVVFKGEALWTVEQVGTAQEVARFVVDGNLDFGPWESVEHEHHPQSRLHWGLRFRFGQANDTPKPSDSFGSGMLIDVALKLADGHQLRMKELIRGDHALRQLLSSAQVNHRAKRGCGRQATPQDDLIAIELRAANPRACPAAAADGLRDRDLDWIAGLEIKSV